MFVVMMVPQDLVILVLLWFFVRMHSHFAISQLANLYGAQLASFSANFAPWKWPQGALLSARATEMHKNDS